MTTIHRGYRGHSGNAGHIRKEPRPILNRVEWEEVQKQVLTQQRNRERYTPVISTYRWWARRPHVLIGAILDAAAKSLETTPIRISDPFSGGGTVAFEAARRGLSVYAQDLYPWPTTGLAIGLSKCAKEEFLLAASRLIKDLSPLHSLYQCRDGKELSHIIRVKVGECPSCAEKVFLFPFSLISLASRSIRERQALFGCRSCGAAHLASRNTSRWRCSTCGKLNHVQVHEPGVFSCPHCSFKGRPKAFVPPVQNWKPVAVQQIIGEGNLARCVLRTIAKGDSVDALPASRLGRDMRKSIPDGLETHRLLDAGFKSWGDLYTDRQVNVIVAALNAVLNLGFSKACKDRLALSVIGLAEMPAYLCRWDRYNLKAFEGLANHQYSDSTLVAETNLLSPLGRGTLSARLRSAAKALDWVINEIPFSSPPKKITNRNNQTVLSDKIVIVTGSNDKQALKDGQIDLVLTDPPYYGDIQYGELSHLFHFWLSKYQPVLKYSEAKEAVPNRYRGCGSDFYVDSIAKCFNESARTLVPRGKLIITFHNRKFCAWQCLAQALIRADLVVLALAIVQAENDADFKNRDGKGMLHDLVLECGRRNEWHGRRASVLGNCSNDIYGLRAMGIAISKAIRKGRPELLLELYEVELKKQGIEGRAIA